MRSSKLGAIDVHAHVVPSHFPPYSGCAALPAWPRMVTDCSRHVLEIGGEKFRALEPECWDPDLRLQAMEQMGITCQAISPLPELLSYWLSVADAAALGHFVNDQIERMCEAHPRRFVGLGMLPLQDPELAARELERLMTRPRFRGIEIGTHVCGVPIGDARFDVFFGAAEALQAAVFVHALHPIGNERLIGPSVLRATIGYPCEMAFAISSLITGGILARHPKLQICFSHGGGAFAMVLPRLVHAWKTSPALRDAMPLSPDTQAAAVHFDDLVYDSRTLRHLLMTFGEEALVIGTDYPFVIQDRDPLGSISQLELESRQVERLCYSNAAKFLGLSG